MKKAMYVLVILFAAVAWTSVLAQDTPACGSGGPCPSPTWWPTAMPAATLTATATPTATLTATVEPPALDPPHYIYIPLIEAFCMWWPWCVVPDGPTGSDPYPAPVTPTPYSRYTETPVPGAPDHR